MAISRKYSESETRRRILAWADRRERTHGEAREKLVAWGVPAREREDLIAWLIGRNALNERRYAMAFASDRFRFHQWGLRKIAHALKARSVSERNIADALASLSREDLDAVLNLIVRKKWDSTRGEEAARRIQRTVRYATGKGFAPDAVWEAVRRLTGNHAADGSRGLTKRSS